MRTNDYSAFSDARNKYKAYMSEIKGLYRKIGRRNYFLNNLDKLPFDDDELSKNWDKTNINILDLDKYSKLAYNAKMELIVQTAKFDWLLPISKLSKYIQTRPIKSMILVLKDDTDSLDSNDMYILDIDYNTCDISYEDDGEISISCKYSKSLYFDETFGSYFFVSGDVTKKVEIVGFANLHYECKYDGSGLVKSTDIRQLASNRFISELFYVNNVDNVNLILF